MTISADSQKATPGPLVDLFDLHLRGHGSTLYYFCSTVDFPNQDLVRWKGRRYTPIPMQAEGFEVTKDQIPKPKIRISNIHNLLSALFHQVGDIAGAPVIRWRTFAQYLDNGSTPDPDEHFPPERWVIDRKTAHNKAFVEFELASSFDQAGRILPGRRVLQGVCRHTYRRYDSEDEIDGSIFDYRKVTCPYQGGEYFTQDGTPTSDASQDMCGKRLEDCRKRFTDNILPFSGFPAVGGFKT